MHRLLARMRRFGAEEKAVAAVEFALIMPFLLALYFGSMEASALFTADKRINTISSTVGDLVAQWDPKDLAIPSATLTGYFTAAQGIISPYPTAGVKQVVSLIYVFADGSTKVLWSRANGTGAVARTENSPYTPLTASSTTNQVSRGGCVVAAETSYSYKPILGQVFTSALNLAHTNYFVPRYGSTAVIDLWDKDLTNTACTTGS